MFFNYKDYSTGKMSSIPVFDVKELYEDNEGNTCILLRSGRKVFTKEGVMVLQQRINEVLTRVKVVYNMGVEDQE